MLEPKFNVCIDSCCDELTFVDLTGDYNNSDNTGGWGFPNDGRGDVTASALNITDPNNVVYAIDITTEVQNDQAVTVLPSQIGLAAGSAIPDGVYYIEWTITTASSYSTPKSFFFYCNTATAVNNLIATLDIDCGCDPCAGKPNNELDKALLAWTYLLALKAAACCGKVDKFQDLIDIIDRLTDPEQCKNC